MEGTGRRKSTSSESELSDGWNLVDTVEVIPGETSDAESVEVIQDELSDSPSSDSEEMETNEKDYQQAQEQILPAENTLQGIGNAEEKPFRMKEFCEAGTVFFILATVALAFSYGLLAIEEGITTVKPLIWNAIYPSVEKIDGANYDLLKVMADLDSYKQENLRLINELEKMYIGFVTKDIGHLKNDDSPLELPELSSETQSDNKFLKELLNQKDLFGNNFSKHLLRIQIAQGTKDKDSSTGNKITLNRDKATHDILTQLQLISIHLYSNETKNMSSDLINLLFEDLDAIMAVSKDEKLKQFSERWNNKLSNFVNSLHLDVNKMIKKLNKHVSKSIFNIHTSFTNKFCNKDVTLLSESELNREFQFLNDKQKDFCNKYLDIIIKYKKDENGKENSKGGKKRSHECKGSRKAENCVSKAQDGLSDSKEYATKISSPKQKNKKGSPLEKKVKNLKDNSSPQKNSDEGYREGEFLRNEGNEYPKDSSFSKTSFSKYRTDSQKENSEERKGWEINASDLKKGAGNYRRPDGDDSKKNKDKIACGYGNRPCRKSDYKHGAKKSKYFDKTEKEIHTVIEMNNYDLYEHDTFGYKKNPENSKVNPNLKDSDLKVNKKRYQYAHEKSGNRYRDPKLNKNDHKYNSSSGSGIWFLSMGEGRANIRSQHQKSDWIFDRAKGRFKNKEESKWIFDRAWARQRCRENPKSTWCNWQDNLHNSHDTDSYHAFR